MIAKEQYDRDIAEIVSMRHHNGGDLWATSDIKLNVGSPFSTLNCASLLSELNMSSSDPILTETADLIFSNQKDDGRFRLSPQGAIYPCHTIIAARALCHLGYADDGRLVKSFEHLLNTRHSDHGWRCKKFSFGRGPETESSNPGPTLFALDAFRYTKYLNRERSLDGTVEFLLDHWRTRIPLGPCHYGIGTLFMQIQYPFNQYNLFYYVYVLSFYEKAKKDDRFIEAFEALRSKLVDGKIVIERQNPKFSKLSFCKKGEPCELATMRFQEILENVDSM